MFLWTTVYLHVKLGAALPIILDDCHCYENWCIMLL